MNSFRSDRGNISELGQVGMSTPQAVVPAAVGAAGSQGATQSNNTTATSSDLSSSSAVPDIKLFYFNKPGEGDLRPPPSISVSNGVGQKMVQLPGAANNPSGFAYLGTLIKQGRETGEGQKVLLTPVIKDGGRFILPRTALAQRSNPNSNAASTPHSEHIYLSQSQQPRRSFVIHNSSLSGKDVGKSMIDSGTVVPKVLPPPKVPLVVCSSRAHDVTLTSVKPIAPKDDISRQTLDVSSFRPLVCKEVNATSDGKTSIVPSQHDLSDITLTTLRDVPPLTPINQTSPTSTKPDADDVEVVGDCEMPRPIIKKSLLKSAEPMTTPCTIPQASFASWISSINETIDDTSSPTQSEESTKQHCKENQCESDQVNSIKTTEPEHTSKESKTPNKQSENTSDSAAGFTDGINASEKNENTQISIKGLCVSNEPTLITDPSVLILKAKSNISGIKVSGTNGHFVRILSAPTNTENKEAANNSSGTIYYRDGKAVVFGSLAKDISNIKDQPMKDKESAEDKPACKEKEMKSEPCGDQVKDAIVPPVLTSSSKLVQKSSSIRIPSTPNADPPAKVPAGNAQIKCAPTLSGGSTHLQIKELSKESAMMERSRKRKGAPLLRDCFKKTIAVKRLEPLPGAMSFEPLQVIEWDPMTGVGTLPGSDIKFVLNSYGALQVYEGDGIKNNTAKPVSGVDVVYANDGFGKDDIGRCIECECYGLLVEFIEERFCSSNCKERYDIRRALTTKRALSHTKETSKKRKLFEIALNKSRPSDENQEVVNKIKSQFKPIEPKPVDSKPPSEAKTTSPSKPESKIIEPKSEAKPVSPSKLTVEPISAVELKASIISKPTVDSSTSTDSNCVPQQPNLSLSLVQVIKPDDSSKTPVTPRTVSPPEPQPPKQESPVKTPVMEEKKTFMEKQQTEQVDISVVTPSTSTPDHGSEKRSPEVFDWSEYLSHMRSHPAWIRLFKDAFPSQPNLFKVAHRLEAIDPQRPSLFCAVSVAQVKGYRLKLHFDGYPKTHDFWVNADSPNIFPCGFCKSHGIDLEPPWGFSKETFNWPLYLMNIKAKAAPPNCFIHKQIDTGEPNLFKVGMKLEAVDKKNSNLVCVATVAAVVDHRILVHFDSWDDSYDYWTEYYSPNIHPVGWCQRNNYVLTPPNGHKRKNFSWRRYLIEVGAEAAPDTAFMVRPPVRFKKGSKLEAIDCRAPHILRVATIKQVLPYQVHVVFDGFPDHFGHWYDDDSPDLHPIGWGTRTGHPLTPPPKLTVARKCGTAGCQGDGNVCSGDLETHSTIADCPFSMDNLEEDNLLPDRLSQPNLPKLPNSKNQHLPVEQRKELMPIQRTRKSRESVDTSCSTGEGSAVSSNKSVTPTIAGALLPGSVAVSSAACESPQLPPVAGSVSSSSSTTNSSSLSPNRSCSAALQSVSKTQQTSSCDSLGSQPFTLKPTQELLEKAEDVIKEAELNAACDKFVSKSLNLVSSNSEIEAYDLLGWDSRKVTSFIESVLHRATNAFYNNKVDGEGLLMLSLDDLSKKLHFSQLEASFIYSNILMLRSKFC